MNPDAEPTVEKPKLKVREVESETRRRRGPRSRKGGQGQREAVRRSRGDTFCLWFLVALVLLAPWWRGSVSALPQAIISAGLLVCLAFWLIRLLISKQSYRPHWIILLVLLFLFVGQFQQIQLPDFLVERVASKQLEVREELAGHLEFAHADVAKGLRSQHQVVWNPSAATYQFAYFGLVAATFFLATRFFNRRDDVLLLAAVIGFSGCLIAIFGTFQKVADPNQIYGQPLQFGGSPFGPFVNRNNASGYLLICLGGALATLAYSCSTLKSRRRRQRDAGLEKDSLWHVLLRDIRALVAGLNPWRIGLLAVCGCIVAGIALSLSRGGMFALVGGLVLLLVYLFQTGSRRAAILLLLFFVPAGLTTLLATGEQESVTERLETLKQDDLLSKELRPVLWRDSLQSLADHTILGSGVGSFPYIYKEYQTFPDTNWCYHAENVFIEMLVTFGVVGGLLLGVGLFAFFLLAIRFGGLGRSQSEKSVAIGAMVFFILVSQVISNSFDFGLLIPANGLLFALCLGALVGVWGAKMDKEQQRDPHRLARLPRWTTLPLVLLFAALTVWNATSFWQVYQTEVANTAARTDNLEELTADEVEESIARLESVLAQQPNLQTHEYLGRLYVMRLRHQFVDYQLANLPPGVTVEREQVWQLSSLRLINLRLGMMPADERQAEIERWMNTDFFAASIRAATEQYEQALLACPLSVRSIVGLAELAYFNQVDIGNYLAAFDRYNVRRTDFLLRIGDVAISHRNDEAGLKYWRGAIELSERVADGIVPTALELLQGRPSTIGQAEGFLTESDIVSDLLPPDPRLIKRMIDKHFRGLENAPLRDLLYQRIKKILGNEVYTDAESNYLLHQARSQTGDILLAIDSLETATMLDPFNIPWKFELAQLHAQVGEWEKAFQQLQKCVDAEPNNDAYEKLYKRVKEILFPESSTGASNRR